MRVVYHPRYNISLFGLERLHPFDSRKYGRAWAVLQKELGSRLKEHHVAVDRPVSDRELLSVHSADYLSRMRRSKTIAATLEMPMFQFCPAWLLRWRVLQPMRWATRGSVIAAKEALKTGLSANLSGGYHHAKPSHGEGFCAFSDIALIVAELRREGLLQTGDRVAYIDLDAHQGNGVCHEFRDDSAVFIFDMYNKDTYPREDYEARRRIDCNVPLSFDCSAEEYLDLLHHKLPPFLDSVSKTARVRLAIYNAGTDVFARDRLGGLRLSEEDVLSRDLFVFQTLEERAIPAVMLLSGGYSQESYRLVANTLLTLLKRQSSSANSP